MVNGFVLLNYDKLRCLIFFRDEREIYFMNGKKQLTRSYVPNNENKFSNIPTCKPSVYLLPDMILTLEV